MELIFTSFIAGVLTVLSPCVLPLLPIIIGGSIKDHGNKWRPYIITLSLAISIIIFTLVLKTSALLINFPPELLQYFSGGIVIFLGLITLFPKTWDAISVKLHLGSASEGMLAKSNKDKGILGSIFTGAALGPVFSSCSPTYAIIIATVLPASFGDGLIDLIAYAIGLSLLMLLISIFGQKIIAKVKFAANPNGIFRKVLAVIFILVGFFIILGLDKTIQTYFANHNLFDATKLEAKIFNSNTQKADGKDAPELTGIDAWVNSNGETIKALKGKVVLVDFWTYSCINCIRTLPYVTAWYDHYKDNGLVVLGIHSPEFQFEKDLGNVQKAVKQYKINYPVGQDNGFATWKAYGNQYWPEEYLINRQGKLVHIHYGEGDYMDTENLIRQLLTEGGNSVSPTYANTQSAGQASTLQTPETYLGYARSNAYVGTDKQSHDTSNTYTLNTSPAKDKWSLGGDWNIKEQNLVSTNNGAALNLNFTAKEVYLVMGADNNTKVGVKLNGKNINSTTFSGEDVDKDGNITIKDYRLYKIVKQDKVNSDQILELTFDKGANVNVFTFGS